MNAMATASFVSASQCLIASRAPNPTTTNHTANPTRPNIIRTIGIVRSRNRSGIEQRDAQRQRVHHSHQDFPARALARPLGELSHVGQQIAVQQIGMMKLRQEMDGLVLGRQLLDIVGAGAEVFPDLMDSAPSVHHAQHLVGGGRQSVELTRLVVLQHIPGPTAKALAVNLRVGAEPGPDVRDPVPGRTEERLRHPGRPVLSPATAMRRRGASP